MSDNLPESNQSDAPATLVVPDEYLGKRLDKILVELFPDYSRSRLQQWLKEGHILVNGETLAGKVKLEGGEVLSYAFPEEEDLDQVEPEDIPLDIVYEDEHILVVNKPAGLVVHPAAGNPNGTLQNGLLFHDGSLAAVPRAGIVHRLDKDTSGLLVVAKTLKSHKNLVDQLQARTVKRIYDAVTFGVMIAGGTVEANMGRHKMDRKKMAVKDVGGKEAITHYRVKDKYRYHTYVQCQLETGRTHQIRVHLSHIGFPLVGDPVYGGRLRIPGDIEEDLENVLRAFERQALHAAELGLIHPETGKDMKWKVPMPTDMSDLLYCLEKDRGDEEVAVESDQEDEWEKWNEEDYDVECVYVDDQGSVHDFEKVNKRM